MYVKTSSGMEANHGGIVASRAVHLLQEKVSPFFPTWAHLDPFIKDYGQARRSAILCYFEFKAYKKHQF